MHATDSPLVVMDTFSDHELIPSLLTLRAEGRPVKFQRSAKSINMSRLLVVTIQIGLSANQILTGTVKTRQCTPCRSTQRATSRDRAQTRGKGRETARSYART